MIGTFQTYKRRGGTQWMIADIWDKTPDSVSKIVGKYPHHFYVDFDPANPMDVKKAWIKADWVERAERVLFDNTEKE